MEKTSKNKLEDVTRLLTLQKIRDVKDLESYKLSVCHPHSAGIDLGSREIYVALSPRIAAEMGLPIVDIDELNEVVGYEGNGFKSSHIGFSSENKTYYGFILSDKWKVIPPSDCVEITPSEYKKLFGTRIED